MCQESLINKTCSKIKGANRCPKGYHVRGTKDIPITHHLDNKDNTKPTKTTNASNKVKVDARIKELEDHLQQEKVKNSMELKATTPVSVLPSNRDELRSFFIQIMREETYQLIRKEVSSAMSGQAQIHTPHPTGTPNPCCRNQ